MPRTHNIFAQSRLSGAVCAARCSCATRVQMTHARTHARTQTQLTSMHACTRPPARTHARTHARAHGAGGAGGIRAAPCVDAAAVLVTALLPAPAPAAERGHVCRDACASGRGRARVEGRGLRLGQAVHEAAVPESGLGRRSSASGRPLEGWRVASKGLGPLPRRRGSALAHGCDRGGRVVLPLPRAPVISTRSRVPLAQLRARRAAAPHVLRAPQPAHVYDGEGAPQPELRHRRARRRHLR